MDDIDENIIVAVSSGVIKSSALAKKLNLPMSTVHFRIKRLEKDGVIRKYTGDIDWKKAGFPMQALILINIDVNLLKKIRKTQDHLLKELLAIFYVRDGYITTGDSDIVVRVISKDSAQLKDILLNHIDSKEGIVKTHTAIILD